MNSGFSMILAIDSKNGLGKNNDLAWRISKDMKHFQKITTMTNDEAKCNALIMGRKTWDSIPKKFRPLPGRVNCILSRSLEEKEIDSAAVYNDFDTCYGELEKQDNIEQIFVIGGSQIYNSLLSHKNLEKIYLTIVDGDYDCDVFFDGIPDNFKLHTISSEQKDGNYSYYFAEYVKKV